MKTTTILEALERADEFVNMYGNQPSSNHYRRSFRQAKSFRAALLSRIEAGDRAREALKMVEWWPSNDDYSLCPWCYRQAWQLHAPDCPRQAALEL